MIKIIVRFALIYMTIAFAFTLSLFSCCKHKPISSNRLKHHVNNINLNQVITGYELLNYNDQTVAFKKGDLILFINKYSIFNRYRLRALPLLKQLDYYDINASYDNKIICASIVLRTKGTKFLFINQNNESLSIEYNDDKPHNCYWIPNTHNAIITNNNQIDVIHLSLINGLSINDTATIGIFNDKSNIISQIACQSIDSCYILTTLNRLFLFNNNQIIKEIQFPINEKKYEQPCELFAFSPTGTYLFYGKTTVLYYDPFQHACDYYLYNLHNGINIYAFNEEPYCFDAYINEKEQSLILECVRQDKYDSDYNVRDYIQRHKTVIYFRKFRKIRENEMQGNAGIDTVNKH